MLLNESMGTENIRVEEMEKQASCLIVTKVSHILLCTQDALFFVHHSMPEGLEILIFKNAFAGAEFAQSEPWQLLMAKAKVVKKWLFVTPFTRKESQAVYF